MIDETSPKELKSQRKKPMQSRSSSLVHSIFEAAARILPKADYEGVTTNQLARVAGVSVGSLYQYFANKDEIFALLLEKNLVETKAIVEATIRNKSTTPLKELIAEAVSTVVDLNLDNREFFARLFIQAPRLNRVKRVMESRDQFITLLAEILKSKSSEVKQTNLDLAAYVIVHSIMGVIQTIVIHPPEPTAATAALKRELDTLCRRLQILR